MKSLCVWVLGSCFLVGAMGVGPAAAQPGAPSVASVKDKKVGKPLKFTIYDRPYFVKNTFEPNVAESFAVLKSLGEFEGVFGVGMVMGGVRPQINDATFNSQMIVTVVKRGPMCHYDLESVTAKGDGIELRYKVKTDPPGAATFSVPLVVAVPNGNYASVTFVENGKEVKVVK